MFFHHRYVSIFLGVCYLLSLLWECGYRAANCSHLQMLQFQLVVVHLALVITLLQWHSSSVLLAEAAPEVGHCFCSLSLNTALCRLLLAAVCAKHCDIQTVLKGGWCVLILQGAKQEQDGFPSEKSNVNCMALRGQTK